jgi:CO dehydrogenase maturation factor
MKVAFVGKGGSGKSTLSSLFTLYLLHKKQHVLVIDADLNIHVPQLLGVTFDPQKQLSYEENKRKIKKYLRGTNKRIKDIKDFVKTTPPGNGSKLVQLNEQNYVIQNFSHTFDLNGYLMYVGTYQKDGIGTSCYHVNLSILENILSHAYVQHNQWIVTDMVAGIDAFSNSLHAQFDALFLVVEPTLESVEVFNQYKTLAQHAGVYDHIFVVGNKVEDETDAQFLQEKIQDKLIGCLKKNSRIKTHRQKGETLDMHCIREEDTVLFEQLITRVSQSAIDEHIRLQKLHKLHLKYIQQDYVKKASGDISDQIDPDFKFE